MAIDYSKFLKTGETSNTPNIDYSKFGYNPTTSVAAPKKQGEILTKTLSPDLGGGTYKMVAGNPNALIKTPRTDYGGLPTKEGYERADIFPVSLGGVNASSTNIAYEKFLPKGEQKPGQLTKTDKYLNEVILPQYKVGKMSLREAQVLATSYLRNEQTGLNKAMENQNLGGKFGELADKIVGFFKNLGKEKQPEISTQDLAKKIAIPESQIGKQTLTQGKEPIFKTAEFGNEMVPSKLQLPETNWAYKTINTIYNIPSEAKANLVNKLTKFTETAPVSPTSVIQKPVLDTPLKRATAGIQTGTAALGMIPQWLALTTGLQAAENVPIIKYPAKILNWGFEKLGQAGVYAADKAVDIAPLSNETKDTIRPVMEELGALAAQLLGAKKAFNVVETFGVKVKAKIAQRQSRGQEVTPEVATEIISEVKKEVEIENYNKDLETLEKEPTPENLQKAVESKPLEPKIKPQEARGEVLTPKTTKPLVPSEITKIEPSVVKTPTVVEDVNRIVIEPTATNKNVARQQQIVDSLTDQQKNNYLEFKRRTLNDFFEFENKFNELRDKYQLDTWNAVRKSDGRAIEKAFDDYRLDFGKIGDMNRGAFIVNDFSQIKPLMKDIKESFVIRKAKNRFESPSYGYRDILVLVRMSDGTKAEIQIMTPSMSQAKAELHSLYEPTRVLESKRRNSFLSSSEYKEYKRLIRTQEKKYGEAWAKDVKLGFAKNRKDLYNITKKQPSQFNLKRLNDLVQKIKKARGETINLKTGDSLTGKKLYAVSPYPERTFSFKPGEVKGGRVANIDGKTIYEYAQRNKDLLMQPGHALGIWYNTETGRWYFDVVITPKQKGAAIAIGKKENQISIANLSKIPDDMKKAFIPTGGTGEMKKGGGVLKRREEINRILTPAKKKATLVKKPSKTYESRVYQRAKSELPEQLSEDVFYRRKNLKQEVKKAVNLIEKDTQKAYDVAMGNTGAPLIERNTTNIALAEKALKEENYKLYAQLTKNRSLRLTEYGQAIVSEKGAVNDNGISRFVKQVISDRLDNLGKTALSELKGSKNNVKRATEAIKNEVKKAKEIINKTKLMDLADAQKLIDSLACK